MIALTDYLDNKPVGRRRDLEHGRFIGWSFEPLHKLIGDLEGFIVRRDWRR